MMANETLRTIEGRSVLRMERQLRHPAEKVWRALTDPAELVHWFPATVQLEPRIGSRVEYVMDGEPGGDGEVLEFDPPRVFAITWSGEVLRWELLPAEDGCLLVLSHTFDDHFGAASFASGWTLCLEALGLRLLGKPIDIEPDTGVLHDHYLEQLGLDQGTAEETSDGWTVRFERQLTRPAETVRPLLAAYDDARWELTTGTGHGARLIVTQTGLATPDKALVEWRERLDKLAADLLKTPPAKLN
ncbi:SRPBCC family protein [Kribbella albertanoniae]|uniref:SRPBCC family protein n=1 Tax=Kribbella albertanoniae TaxID=1266829 RepID=A0A4R4QA98_9ACTN|nr:SRPBCC family protein [Kribbella albertanoniae]TDC32306.1 SRPBCC family protein [Kribbella albertanoniae]